MRKVMKKDRTSRRSCDRWRCAALSLLTLLTLCLIGGCVERTLTVQTNPPGALVYLNDQEFGRTPVTRDFLWYGNYDVEVRKEGYRTIKTHQWLVAPAYQWVPFDL